MDDVQLSELYYALSANVQRVYSKEHLKDVHIHVHNISICPETGFEVLIRFRDRKRVELSYLPASDTEKEAQDIGLLLLLKLLNIFQSSHLSLTY